MATSQVFPSWWLALCAVPPSKTARDWWATEDARSPRHDRLYRVWGDPTDKGTPPYHCSEKEKHLVITLWENLTLFSPRDTVAALYREFQFDAPGPAVDLCWSCEFNLAPQDRQLDIVIHIRFPDRDEIILGEAKAGRKKFADKDLDPRDVLRRDVFRFAGARRYFLLGDAPVPADWHERGYRHLTWQNLFSLQSTLCDTLPEPPEVRDFVRKLIRVQFAGHGIATGLPEIENDISELQAEAKCRLSDTLTERCQHFIECAIQHLRCLSGLPSDTIPFAYLAAEPKVEQIIRRWRLGCGSHAVNGKAYWKLPARDV